MIVHKVIGFCGMIITELPPEILLRILQYILPRDIPLMSVICKIFHQTVSSRHFKNSISIECSHPLCGRKRFRGKWHCYEHGRPMRRCSVIGCRNLTPSGDQYCPEHGHCCVICSKWCSKDVEHCHLHDCKTICCFNIHVPHLKYCSSCLK